MSAFRFDSEALSTAPPRRARPPLRVERAPEGIRWSHPPAPADAPTTLLDALLEAWSRVAESLAFRHERILNLAYVPTTTDADSLHRSAQAIGVSPTPPLAASTWMAITVQPIRGQTEWDIPDGLAVQTVPTGADRPQVFETDAALTAKVEWNAMGAWLAPAAPRLLTTTATSALVDQGGVSAGHRVAVTGRIDGVAFAASATLRDVQIVRSAPDPKGSVKRLRRVDWGEPLVAASAARPIDDARAFELGPGAGLFGAKAADWSAVPDSIRFGLSPPRGGLVRLPPPGKGAAPTEQTVAAFARVGGEPRAVATQGDVWIVASDAGLFRSADAGESWAGTGNHGWQVTALCWSDAGLYIGTASHGVWRSTDAGVTWEAQRGGTVVARGSDGLTISMGRLPRCGVRALGAFATGPDSVLVLAGTNAGPYYQLVGDPAWYPHADGLPLRGPRTGSGGPAISAVAVDPVTSALLLGTDRGLFRASSLDDAWERLDLTDEPSPVSAMGPDGRGAVVVAFESGALYRLSHARADPMLDPDGTEIAKGPARSIDATANGAWLGTEDGCFWSDDGEAWARVCDRPVRALSTLPDGGVVAATPLEGPEDVEWPGFGLATDHLDLDALQPRAMPGPALVVDESKGASLVVTVTATTQVQLADFGLRCRVTRLHLDPEPQLATFARRTTRVYPALRALGALAPEPVDAAQTPAPGALAIDQVPDRTLPVDGATPDPTGRPVLVSGPLLRTRLPEGSVIVGPESGSDHTLPSAAMATLIGVPTVRDGMTSARVRTDDGVEGTVRRPDLPLLAGDPKAPPTVVLRHVLGFEDHGEYALLTLDEPLGVPLDPTAITVFGNVVSATHGQRVDCEVLGSGDPNRSGQRFKLMLPLRWVAGADGSATPSLEVRVSDQTWRRADHRGELGRGDRAYSLECDSSGSAWVSFGDGQHGERPTAGVENITAHYRSGGGSAGNQPARAIRLLRSRPPGVKSAVNLLPASGGCDVEAKDDLRARIPLHARVPDHVVSLADFLDHLRTLQGIAKVSVRPLWNGHGHFVHLTVATTDAANGWALDPTSQLAVALRGLAARAPVLVKSVDVAWFTATLDIAVAPDLDPEPVRAAVCAKVQSACGFDARDIGAPVVPSAIVSVAMGVAGVTNAALRSLRPVSEPDATPDAKPDATPHGTKIRGLPGVTARLDAATGSVLPGRLWLLSSSDRATADSAAPARTGPSQGLRVRAMGAP